MEESREEVRDKHEESKWCLACRAWVGSEPYLLLDRSNQFCRGKGVCVVCLFYASLSSVQWESYDGR